MASENELIDLNYADEPFLDTEIESPKVDTLEMKAKTSTSKDKEGAKIGIK